MRIRRLRGCAAAFAVAALAYCLLAVGAAEASISLTTLGTAYTQDFNTLASSGGPGTALPVGWTFLETGANADSTYGIGTGSANAGNTYSFGAAGGTDRAFGGLQSGSLIPTIGAEFTNNTVAVITSLAISYTGEQWRRVARTSAVDALQFQYSLDASDGDSGTTGTGLAAGTWTAVGTLDFTGSVGTAATGNSGSPVSISNISGLITGLSIPAGATFWIRWIDVDAPGADDGLAVDDFSLTPFGAPAIDAVPELSTSIVWALLFGCAVIARKGISATRS